MYGPGLHGKSREYLEVIIRLKRSENAIRLNSNVYMCNWILIDFIELRHQKKNEY